MMNLDEGNDLIVSNKNKINIVDTCLNNPKSNKNLLLILLSLAMGNAADAVEIICVGFIMAEMSNISSTDKEFLSAAVFMGMLIGGVIGGYVSDIVGRKICLKFSLLINAIAGLLSAAAPDINVLIAFRVLGGIGIGGSVPIVFSLGAEIFPSNVRGKYLSLIASFWMVGAIFAAFTAWIMLGYNFNDHKIMPHVGWRYYAIVSALPAIIALIMAHRIVPESPRYLIEKTKYNEAATVLNSLSTVTVTGEDLAHSEAMQSYSEDNATNFQTDTSYGESTAVRNSNEYIRDGHRNNTNNNLENPIFPLSNTVKQKKSTIVLLFQGKLLFTSLILMTIWFTLSFGSYGMSTWISVLFADVGIGNAYAASFIFALANLPGNIISITLIELYGRRWLLSVGMCLAGICTIGFAIDTADAAVVVTCAALFNCFSVVGWNSLDCLSVECFPTHVRTSAMGVLAAAGRLGAISAQFVNGSLESNIPLLLFVTSGCSIFGGLTSWLLSNDPAGAALPEDNEEECDTRDRKSEYVHNPIAQSTP